MNGCNAREQNICWNTFSIFVLLFSRTTVSTGSEIACVYHGIFVKWSVLLRAAAVVSKVLNNK